jgi:NADH-quinone oxidoreductase subunit H
VSIFLENPWLAAFLRAFILFNAVQLVVAYLTLAERKVSAWMQDRLGPNRVGPWGLLQPIADGVKFFFKEDITPPHADKWLYRAAPLLAFLPPFVALSVIPFGGTLEIGSLEIPLHVADVNVGLLMVFAVGAMGVYGIFVGGWSSSNKYSILGGLRSAAQLISYEIPMAFAAIGVFMASGSFRARDIVVMQETGMWNALPQFLGFLVFLVAAFAETNRLPFDLPEAETELVGGYHTEYSSMKFGMFFMGEYAHMIVASCLMTLMYLGGWDLPFVEVTNPLAQMAVFAAKTGFFLFLYLWVRWTLPRFRYDQLMRLGWKVLLPLSFVNILWTGWLIMEGKI